MGARERATFWRSCVRTARAARQRAPALKEPETEVRRAARRLEAIGAEVEEELPALHVGRRENVSDVGLGRGLLQSQDHEGMSSPGWEPPP